MVDLRISIPQKQNVQEVFDLIARHFPRGGKPIRCFSIEGHQVLLSLDEMTIEQENWLREQVVSRFISGWKLPPKQAPLPDELKTAQKTIQALTQKVTQLLAELEDAREYAQKCVDETNSIRNMLDRVLRCEIRSFEHVTDEQRQYTSLWTAKWEGGESYGNKTILEAYEAVLEALLAGEKG
jgi:hypothetical protein